MKIKFILPISLFVISGCGLIPIPHGRTIPEGIDKVVVKDIGSGLSLKFAEVNMRYASFENWSKSFPPRGVADCSGYTGIIQLSGDGEGSFGVESTRKTAYVKPWGIGPLGTCIYEDYAVCVEATASGYHPLKFVYYPGALPTDELIAEDGSSSALLENKTLSVRLKKQ